MTEILQFSDGTQFEGTIINGLREGFAKWKSDHGYYEGFYKNILGGCLNL